MSGHSGFQAIGNGYRPPVVPPQVGGSGGVHKAPPSGGAPGAVDEGGLPGEGQPVRADAKSLSGKLDALLLRAAEYSTKAVSGKKIAKAVENVGLPRGERARLEGLADRAAASFAALSQFSGKQIAAALVAREGAFEWKEGDAVASAIRQALDDQAELAEALHELANDPRVSGGAFEAVCDQALAADRRQSEIFSLAVELADAVQNAGNDPALNARLDAKLAELLPRQALTMQGNEAAIEQLKTRLQPLADRLEAFKQKPDASISGEEFAAYSLEVAEAENALAHGIAEGFPTGDGGRWEPDHAFLSAAKALVGAAKQFLGDVRKEIGLRSLAAFAKAAFAVPNDFVPAYKENLDAIRPRFPRLAAVAELRHRLDDLAKQYVEKPDDRLLSRMEQAAKEMAAISEPKLREELKLLRAIGPRQFPDMTDDDWTAFTAEMSHASGMVSQVVHFKLMARKIDHGMSPEQFLSTSSARLLVEGRFSFSSLVETRIHGMPDADVDPTIDDTHMTASTPLGRGNTSAVSLVEYDDGREFVFKPEAQGRLGMASLQLSQGYESSVKVADLNIATQRTADVLGLDDIMPHSTVGSHKGRFGVFMEKAPGAEAAAFAEGKAKTGPGKLSASQVRRLADADHAKVAGELLRKTNRLEWFDLITGQGDRHGRNYMVDVGDDLTVEVKAIDNDQSFPAYRTGLRTYRLEGAAAGIFLSKMDAVLKAYPAKYHDEIRRRLAADPGIRKLPDGALSIDPTRFKNAELHWVLKEAVGLHGTTIPDFIDQDLYDRLQTLKSGPARDRWIADLRARLPEAAVTSAIARLDEAIAHAESLKKAGRVVAKADFAKRDVQSRLLAPQLAAPPYPIQPTADKRFQVQSGDLQTHAVRQTRSLFRRDLFSAIYKKGWLQ